MVEADDFGEVQRTFETEGGERVSKIKTQRGGDLYYSEERGQISQSEYSSASSQRREVQTFSQKEVDEISKNELSERYQATQTGPISDLPPGSVARARQEQKNMFVGFLSKEDTPDDRIEAAKQYEKMVKEIRGAGSEEEIKDIKNDYNIGGS